MNKSTSTLILCGIFVCSFVLMANKRSKSEMYQSVSEKHINQEGRSNGSPGDYTGSIGDDFITCTVCHSSGADFNLTSTITTNIPITGYVLGTTYLVQVSATTDGTESGRGFELTAENSIGTTVGTYDLTGATGTPKIITSGGSVTHSNENSNSWSFNWIAPVTNEGMITFYTSVLAVNGSGNGGDETALTSYSADLSTLGMDEISNLKFEMFPNPTSDYLNIQLPNNIITASVGIYDMVGKQVLLTEIDKYNHNLNVSELSKGVYIVRLITQGKTGLRKLIKQ